MLTVHHLENSRSQRILWLLEELGAPYEIKRYARDTKTSLAPPELRAIHPLGKSPVITDGDRVVAESGAIVTYLIETYGQGQWRPAAGTPEHDRYEFWIHYAEGSLMPLLLLKLILGRIKTAKLPFFVRPIANSIADKVDGAFPAPQLQLHLGYINDQLAQTTWLAGEQPTGADVQMSFPLEAARTRVDMGAYPNISEYVDRIHSRPAYKRGLEKGGPYAYA